jgi:hypothetical protein
MKTQAMPGLLAAESFMMHKMKSAAGKPATDWVYGVSPELDEFY